MLALGRQVAMTQQDQIDAHLGDRLSRLLWGMQGGAEGLAGQADSAWDLPLGAIVLGVRQMGLSGWQSPECMALENELTAWQQAGEFNSHDTALRSVPPSTTPHKPFITPNMSAGSVHVCRMN